MSVNSGICSNCIYWEAIKSIYCPHLAAVAHKNPDLVLPCATDYSMEAVKLVGRIVYACDEITVVSEDGKLPDAHRYSQTSAHIL